MLFTWHSRCRRARRPWRRSTRGWQPRPAPSASPSTPPEGLSPEDPPAGAADEVGPPRVPEELADRLRLAQVMPVVTGRAVLLRPRRLPGRLALPAPREPGACEGVQVGVGGGGNGPPPRPRVVERGHGERLAITESLHLGNDGHALGPLQPVELLLPCQVADHPRDRVDGAEPARRLLGRDVLEAADPFAAREPQLRDEGVWHAPMPPASAS